MDSSDGDVRRTSGNIKRHASGKGSTKHKKKDQHESKGLDRSYSQDESMEVVTTKKNGYMDGEEVEAEEDKTKHSASIKDMWKKAFKSLKSNDSKLSKKGNQTKRKVSESEMEVSEPAQAKDIDPVYSLLKSAAYLPKSSKPGKDSPSNSFFGSRGDSLDNSSKTSSPSMSASISPKSRRKKLTVRMKSFSLDLPDLPRQLLGIDVLPKKSSSFTNSACGQQNAVSPPPPAPATRLGSSDRSTSQETEDSRERSKSVSPPLSPKSKKKEPDVYVSLYHFRGKEKDNMDLRPGSRVTVKNPSNRDWWKGKCNGKSGYFPAKYLLKLQKYQRVYQVTCTTNLTEIDGVNGMRLHKDQIVLGVGDPDNDAPAIHIKAANNREAMCPAEFLAEV